MSLRQSASICDERGLILIPPLTLGYALIKPRLPLCARTRARACDRWAPSRRTTASTCGSSLQTPPSRTTGKGPGIAVERPTGKWPFRSESRSSRGPGFGAGQCPLRTWARTARKGWLLRPKQSQL